MQEVAQGSRESNPIRRIVVPVEGSDREYIVQEQAVTLAAALDVPVKAVHVRPAIDGHGNVFEWLEKMAKQWGVEVTTRNVDGDDAGSEIVQELRPLDLVVIGTSHMGSKYHLGSVAEHLVRHAPCPVQIVRLPA